MIATALFYAIFMTGVFCWTVAAALAAFMLWTAWQNARRAHAKRAQKHVDVDTLANAAKRRAQRVEAYHERDDMDSLFIG